MATQGERITVLETSLFGTNGDKGFIEESRDFYKETREFMQTTREYMQTGQKRYNEYAEEKLESEALANNNKLSRHKIKWLSIDRIIIIVLAFISVFQLVRGLMP